MKVKQDEPLAPHTTFGIGGKARVLYEPETYEELLDISEREDDLLKEAYFLGRGSNLLIEESRIQSPVIRLRGEFKEYQFDGSTVTVGAAVLLPELAVEAASRDLSGLEWAAGVPGSVGGAIAMNAGAYDGETFDRLTEIEVLTRDGERKTISAEEVDSGYRSCELRGDVLILGGTFKLDRSEGEESTKITQKYLRNRRQSQPVGRKSAGCIFRNPKERSAGELIDQAGLKGASIGAIQVSDQHANYFVNNGGGTFREAMDLIDQVRSEVEQQYDVQLPLEVQVVKSKS